MKRLKEDITAFGVNAKNEGWDISANKSDEYSTVEVGAECFMKGWHQHEGVAKEKQTQIAGGWRSK